MSSHLQSYYNFLMMYSQKDNKMHFVMQSRRLHILSHSSQTHFSIWQITTVMGSFERGGEYIIC